MNFQDDDLTHFEEHGAPPLPATTEQGFVESDGAQIWYATVGTGDPVVLLHGGLGNSGNWGHQVPALVEQGYRPILIDSRGHGRSTRDEQPYAYELMAADLLRVLDVLEIERAALVGWSDGACVALILGLQQPERVSGVFFFACNMDPSGTKPFEFSPVLGRIFARHQKEYAALSATPDRFNHLLQAVERMQRTEPNYSAEQLGQIKSPVAIVQSEADEFIMVSHARYLADTIPNATLLLLERGTHFAPLQVPYYFNQVVLSFLDDLRR